MTRVAPWCWIVPAIAAWLGLVSSVRSDDAPLTGSAHDPTRPLQLLWTAQRDRLLVVEGGAPFLTLLDIAKGRVIRRVAQPYDDTRATLGNSVFVAMTADEESIAMISPWRAEALVRSGNLTGYFGNVGRQPPRRLEIDANPQAIAFTPDGSRLLVACDPPGPADRTICVVALESGTISRRPIPGSSNLRGLAVDPSGKFALAVHLLPKADLPATQIEQGWVFTNAISYVPLNPAEPVVTLPLDLRTQAFANPEGVAISPDGRRAYVAHAGADVVSVIDLPKFIALANRLVAKNSQPGNSQAVAANSRSYRREDLTLTRQYVITRIPVGAAPRGIAVSPNGTRIAVANRLDDSISLIDPATNRVQQVISLPQAFSATAQTPTTVSLVDRGERLFHSGRLSFGGQFSCASCHPDGHTDGLNWDLPADGFNNFQNTKTLWGISGTAPYGWLGGSATLRDRFSGTLRHLFQHEPTEDEAAALEAYLSQLPPLPPLRNGGDEVTAAVVRGRELFQTKAGCASCHQGDKLTDGLKHNVGTAASSEFDTPSLLGVSQSAPYLHDGRAKTLVEIFEQHNSAGLHGQAAELSTNELRDLIEYLRGL